MERTMSSDDINELFEAYETVSDGIQNLLDNVLQSYESKIDEMPYNRRNGPRRHLCDMEQLFRDICLHIERSHTQLVKASEILDDLLDEDECLDLGEY